MISQRQKSLLVLMWKGAVPYLIVNIVVAQGYTQNITLTDGSLRECLVLAKGEDGGKT